MQESVAVSRSLYRSLLRRGCVYANLSARRDVVSKNEIWQVNHRVLKHAANRVFLPEDAAYGGLDDVVVSPSLVENAVQQVFKRNYKHTKLSEFSIIQNMADGFLVLKWYEHRINQIRKNPHSQITTNSRPAGMGGSIP